MALVHNPFVPTPQTKDRKPGVVDPKYFADMVSHMDNLVGRIVTRVTELGIAEDTLILFTGDNGTNRKIRSKVGRRTVRGGKGLTTNAGTHVPLIAYWPGTIAAGKVCDDLTDFSDFLPTLAAAAGTEPPAAWRCDGHGFLPQLRGEKGAPREWITCFYHPRPITRPNQTAVRFARDKRFKLYGDGRLFDLHDDVFEKTPIQDESAAARSARTTLERALATLPAKAARTGKLR